MYFPVKYRKTTSQSMFVHALSSIIKVHNDNIVCIHVIFEALVESTVLHNYEFTEAYLGHAKKYYLHTLPGRTKIIFHPGEIIILPGEMLIHISMCYCLINSLVDSIKSCVIGSIG